MAELKLEIPDELEFIKQVPEIDWSILLNRLVRSKLDKILRLKRIVAKSKLTEKDVAELSDKINKALSKRYLKSLS